MTQLALARVSGVAQNTISKIEVGSARPDVVTALRLARALGTEVETLFGHLVPRAPRRRVRASQEGAAAEAAE